MPPQSMTGFARDAGTTGVHSWAWEIKSVNGRGLDIRLRVPPGFDAAGEAARKEVAAALSRGQCQLTLTVTRQEGVVRAKVNRELLRDLVAAVAAIDRPGDISPASLDGLLAVRGVVEIEGEGSSVPTEDVLAAISRAGARLVLSLKASRAEEGAALGVVLARVLDDIAELVERAETHPARQPDAIRARLAEQVAALVGGPVALDPSRLHQEAALLATRADIREEIDRLRAHVASARELLAADGPIGRKLDFLAQEFGRESNTLCAKASDLELSRIGLDLKAAVDQFREQVQNVE